MNATANHLEVGFQILWYEIKSVLGRGGFGVTYLAKDTNLNLLVAIKEYLPFDFASRDNDSTVKPKSAGHNDIYAWGLDCFMNEAQTLAGFKHSNIVRILSVFKYNNTGYMVMEYEHGRVLSDIYEERQKLTQAELEHYFFPLMEGLQVVHSEGFIHRDIKPGNIYIRSNNTPVLLDFGASRQAIGGKTKTLTAMLSAGYAPFEQYHENLGQQGPWTDIYSLGASLFQGITGEKPMESTMRGMAVLDKGPDPYHPLSFSQSDFYSRPFLRAIDEALMLQIRERPQSLENFIAMLRGDIELPNLASGRFETATRSNRGKTVVRPKKRGLPADEVKPKYTETNFPALQCKTQNNARPVTGHAPSHNEARRNVLSPGKSALIVIFILSICIVVASLYPLELSEEEKKQLQITLLLEEAGVHFETGNYYDPQEDSAISIYNEVIALDPENRDARKALGIIGNFYLLKAEIQVEKYDFSAAVKSMGTVKTISPDFPGLTILQSKLELNMQRQKSLIDAQRTRQAEKERIERERIILMEKVEEVKNLHEELARKEEQQEERTETDSLLTEQNVQPTSKPAKDVLTLPKEKMTPRKSGLDRSKVRKNQSSKEKRLRKIKTRN